MVYNVRDFGAVGDGSVLETAAIEAAINACAENGGGTVYVPAGRYICRSIHLKSNMTLYLESGSVIEMDPTIGGLADAHDGGLIVIRHEREIKICGGGRLHGNDIHFVTEMKPEEKRLSGPWAHPITYWGMDNRPHMLLFEDSEYIDVEGITISNSPVYTGRIDRCHHMNFVGVHVKNRLDIPNSDGLHFGSCTYVNVTGCDLICGDDCIAIDSTCGGESHHITVTGCTFDASVNVFRIFTGLDGRTSEEYPDTDVHDIAASGCTCNGSGVFNLTAERGHIYNVSMTGFTINTDLERLGNCAFLMTDRGHIHDCVFSNVTARHNGAIAIYGDAEGAVERITFRDWSMCITPMEKAWGMGMPDPLLNYAVHHYAPYGVHLRHARDIRFRDVDFAWGKGGNMDDVEIPALQLDRCENVETEGLRIR